jgi:hypothetical protein
MTLDIRTIKTKIQIQILLIITVTILTLGMNMYRKKKIREETQFCSTSKNHTRSSWVQILYP